MKKKSIRLLERLRQIHSGIPKDVLHARILCGDVRVDGTKIRDPKAAVSGDSRIEFVDEKVSFSRGTTKLDGALDRLNVTVQGSVFIDAGASTGGFTHSLLDHGATYVHAVDVGYNQLDFRLRTDPRVRVHERTNIMECDPESFDPRPDHAVCDLSFRSTRGAARHILNLLAPGGILLALVKPQFEWRVPDAGFRGVVPDEKVLGIVNDLLCDLVSEWIAVIDAVFSPIRGAKGNIEVFLCLEAGNEADGKTSKIAELIAKLDHEMRSL
jgi:23S rRNA (cytidine1920-2'-O)/16S rRNA (cytidine1409-2'-O)-methyltransferase